MQKIQMSDFAREELLWFSKAFTTIFLVVGFLLIIPSILPLWISIGLFILSPLLLWISLKLFTRGEREI